MAHSAVVALSLGQNLRYMACSKESDLALLSIDAVARRVKPDSILGLKAGKEVKS